MRSSIRSGGPTFCFTNRSANYYRAGRDVTEAFAIERFKVEPRDRPAYGAALLVLSSPQPKSAEAEATFLNDRSPGLLAHLRRVADDYDAFIFTPYRAATTLQALPFVAERAIVMPQLDADPLRFAHIVRERLAGARAFLLFDDAEREALVATLGGCIIPHCRVIGPPNGDLADSDMALAGIDAVVDNLACGFENLRRRRRCKRDASIFARRPTHGATDRRTLRVSNLRLARRYRVFVPVLEPVDIARASIAQNLVEDDRARPSSIGFEAWALTSALRPET